MPRRDTKREIIDLFVAEMEHTSLAEIHVAELIAKLGINRNTFYYHYSSKYDVAMSILHNELDAALREEIDESELITTTLNSKGSKMREYAYYMHRETGARTLDCAPFFKALARCLVKRKRYYAKLFDMREYEFTLCLRNLYLPVLTDDIKFILGGRYMPDVTMNLLANQCVEHLLSSCRLCLTLPDGESLLDDKVNPFWNMLHESIYSAIQSHPINRYRPTTSRTRRNNQATNGNSTFDSSREAPQKE